MELMAPTGLHLVVTATGLAALPQINGVKTNLPPAEFAEVMQAIDEKRVTWDEKASTVFESSASGEFDYNGVRYGFTESWERPDSLTRI